MKKSSAILIATGLFLAAAPFLKAEERRAAPPRAGVPHGIEQRPMEPRTKGIPQHGSWHNVRPATTFVRSPVLLDRRSHVEIRRDPHVVVFNHVGWRPVGHWHHWHRDWGAYWRLNDWHEIQTVICEAVNTQTEFLYPVTETREASWFWTADLVNNVAARALDECAAEGGQPANYALVERECWNSIY